MFKFRYFKTKYFHLVCGINLDDVFDLVISYTVERSISYRYTLIKYKTLKFPNVINCNVRVIKHD